MSLAVQGFPPETVHSGVWSKCCRLLVDRRRRNEKSFMLERFSPAPFVGSPGQKKPAREGGQQRHREQRTTKFVQASKLVACSRSARAWAEARDASGPLTASPLRTRYQQASIPCSRKGAGTALPMTDMIWIVAIGYLLWNLALPYGAVGAF